MRQKWTFEKLQAEALKYKTRWEFQQKNLAAYKAAYKRKILDIICKHMPTHSQAISGKNNPSFKWTNEMLFLEALKYKSRIDFAKNSAGAYRACISRGILDKACTHMVYLQYPWTKEEVILEALKYNTRSDFQFYSSAYQVAIRWGILDEICGHMIPSVTEAYTYEELKQEALKYTTRVEFQKNNPGAYVVATKRKVLDEICGHMLSATCTSLAEKELFKEINKYFSNLRKLCDRKVNIENKPYIKGFDIDIYVEELKKGIEFDGTYYHSFKYMRKTECKRLWTDEDIRNYHELKDSWFASKGIQILHVKEEDWTNNKQACIDKCLKFLNI